MTTDNSTGSHPDAVAAALRQQADEDAHDRSLVVARLAWTPEQRLDAHAASVRWYLSIRPDGPLICDV